jgi:hypothetical protein
MLDVEVIDIVEDCLDLVAGGRHCVLIVGGRAGGRGDGDSDFGHDGL